MPDTEGHNIWVSALQSSPSFGVWNPPVDVLHVTGREIIPGATYEVRMIRQDYLNGGCGSEPLFITTGKWGDVVAPFGGVAQPNFLDISAVLVLLAINSDTP